MAEQTSSAENSNAATKDTAAGSSQAQGSPSVDIEKLAQMATERATLALENKLKETHKGVSKEEINTLLEKQRLDIARQISGQKDEDEVNPVHKRFVEDPTGFVATIVDLTRENIKKEQAEVNRMESERQRALRNVLSEREDITRNKATMEMFSSLYAMESESKEEEARMKSALTKLDSLLEESGAGKAEERIRKAAGVSVSSGSGRATDKESAKKTHEDLAKEELVARKQAFKKSRNLYVDVH